MSGRVFRDIKKIPDGNAKNIITPGCLVLEGGAFRGIYTSGVLDCFMENDINLQTTIGVSAGALNGYNYVSGNIGRSARVNLTYRHDKRWVGSSALRRNNGIIGFDFLFNEYKKLVPVNEEKLMDKSMRLVTVATNCTTGKAEFFEKDCGCLEQAIKASASMPVVSKMVDIDNRMYLDGSCSDAKIPLMWALANKFEKIIVVRTRNRGYRAKNGAAYAESVLYRKYPELVNSLKDVPKNYNLVCDKMDELEKEGKIIVLAPEKEFEVKKLEGDMDKLGRLYFAGYNDAKNALGKIKTYLSL